MHTNYPLNIQSENTNLKSQLKWLKQESDEARVASEANLKEVLGIAEELRVKNAEQSATIEQFKRLDILY